MNRIIFSAQRHSEHGVAQRVFNLGNLLPLFWRGRGERSKSWFRQKIVYLQFVIDNNKNRYGY